MTQTSHPQPVSPGDATDAVDLVRACGACTYCCHLPDIDALEKPANLFCRHCLPGRGCAIYPERPALCRDFQCLWMSDPALGNEWQPLVARLMVYRQGPQLTVLVDPAFPQAWMTEPYHSALRSFAADAEEAGGYVIVFCGDAVHKVEP